VTGDEAIMKQLSEYNSLYTTAYDYSASDVILSLTSIIDIIDFPINYLFTSPAGCPQLNRYTDGCVETVEALPKGAS
jgi:hypothetical protein